MALDFETYTEATDDLAVYPDAGEGSVDAVVYSVLGLASKAGELSKLAKRLHRGDGPDMEALKKSLGDAQWYIARIAKELDLDLDEVAESNITRLEERKKHGGLNADSANR